MMNVCGTFHSNPSTKYTDIASSEIGVNRQQTTNGWTDNGQTNIHYTECLCHLLLEAEK